MTNLDDRNRLAELDDLVVATEKPDARLDELCRRTAEAAASPQATITLVVQHAQLFRASVGLPPALAAARGTSRCDSFCQLVVASDAPLVVTDAKSDARVPTPLVERFGTRAYLGIPLRLRGRTVGSLCALDREARPFSDGQIAAITSLAAEVELRFEQLTQRAAQRRLRAHVEVFRALADVRDDAAALARLAGEIGPLLGLLRGFRDGTVDAAGLTDAAAVLAEPFAAADGLAARIQSLRDGLDDVVDALRVAESQRAGR